MIECVTLENNHCFSGNPLREQHRLRYRSIIVRQKWDVPTVREMEFDSYDNPAAHYLVRRDLTGKVVGVSRLYPTTRPYMLEQAFPYLVTKTKIPKDPFVLEGSRFCVDETLPFEERKLITHELILAGLEFSLSHGIRSIIGVMYPVYWKNIFVQSGWNVEWLGDIHRSAEGHKIIAGELKVSQAVLDNVRSVTGINQPVLYFPESETDMRVVA